MLHETIQRRVCRIAFFVGCVLPTTVVLCVVTRVWIPGYERRWELPLEQLLDCKATVHQLRMPRPGITQFQRVMFADPETHATWVTLHGVAHERCYGQDRITIALAEVDCSVATEFADRIERLLRCAAPKEAELTIADLVLLRDDASWNIADVYVHINESASGRCLQVWSEGNARGPRLLVERNRQLNPPATRVTFQTGDEPLPCWALAFWDLCGPLGWRAQFHGRFQVIASRDSVQGELSGRFSQLDVATKLLSGKETPNQMDIEELRWNDARARDLLTAIQPRPVPALLTRRPHLENPQITDEWPRASALPGEVSWELGPLQSWPQAVKVAHERQPFVR